MLSQPAQPAHPPLLIGTGISELGEQVAVLCVAHHGNLTAWFSAQRLGRGDSSVLNCRVSAVRLDQRTVCSAAEIQHARLTPGLQAQMLVTELQPELHRLSAAPHSTTSSHELGFGVPERGKHLVRGHTAFIQHITVLGPRDTKGEQNSHELHSLRAHLLVEQVNTQNQRLQLCSEEHKVLQVDLRRSL